MPEKPTPSVSPPLVPPSPQAADWAKLPLPVRVRVFPLSSMAPTVRRMGRVPDLVRLKVALPVSTVPPNVTPAVPVVALVPPEAIVRVWLPIQRVPNV